MTDVPWLYVALFLGGLFAGWVDSIAGGGGLITIPLLLWVGLPPQCALGTNKLQASFGSFTAAGHYVRGDVVSLPAAVPGILLTFIGAASGAFVVQSIPSGMLGKIIPILLIAVAVYLFFAPTFGQRRSTPRMKTLSFYAVFGLVLGFYDGFFGPGVGSFWAIAFVLFLGVELREATGLTKVMNFTSNIVSLLVFLAGGQVLYRVGLVMGAGQIIGARIGSGLVIKRGARFVRPILLAVVFVTAAKLLFDQLH
jgi:uncharacterized membrane protein YfcA